MDICQLWPVLDGTMMMNSMGIPLKVTQLKPDVYSGFHNKELTSFPTVPTVVFYAMTFLYALILGMIVCSPPNASEWG